MPVKSEKVMCKMFKFWSFLRKKSVSSVCKLLQLLGELVPQTSRIIAPRAKLAGATTTASGNMITSVHVGSASVQLINSTDVQYHAL